MILILSEPGDLHAQGVADKLAQRGAECLWFDHAQFPCSAQISLTYASTGLLQPMLCVQEKMFDLSRITAAWDRRPRAPKAHETITDSLIRHHVEQESAAFLSDLWHTLDCLWLPATNSKVLRAQHKASQLQVAAALGFVIPPTLITNNPQDLLAFYRQHNGQIVSKAFYHATLQCEQRAKRPPYGMFAKPVGSRDVGYADTVRYLPTIFQAYVPKEVELRITVVGQQVFAVAIHSQQTRHTRHDWRRYDLAHTPHKPHDLPEQVRGLCLQLVEQLGLCYGAIDMVLTPDGRYVFLEVNPSGQYLWLEKLTGLPISDAICDLLLSREASILPAQGA
jgi:glutathione synthase/RimK-type ligase-like ATP-grasp enzyme